MFDIAVIGGGIIGGSILRELTKYSLSVCLLEKENDVCMGQSKANSGIVHAGFDAKPYTLKAKFNILGNKMMKKYARELGVKYYNNGSLVVAYNEEEQLALKDLYNRGISNGVKKLKIINEKKLKKLEPNISDTAKSALLAKTGGIICPYELTIACIGNAMDNGAKLFTNFEVVSAKKNNDHFDIISKDNQNVQAKIVINACGLGSEKVANCFGDTSIEIGGRKGEYILLDNKCNGYFKKTIFKTPTAKGKGILISPTVDNNIILGPTAEETDTDDTSTTIDGLNLIKLNVNMMAKNVPLNNCITSFSGIRAYSKTHDFIIKESESVKGLINVCGIESPGLTSSPAIAKYVVSEIVSKLLVLEKNKSFNPKRKPDYFFKRLSIKQKNKIIKDNPSYGKIVCRCEQITEGEILRALRENPKACDVDGIKRRTRAGMGRCQGGFCSPSVVDLISKELNIPLEEITKKGKDSKILIGKEK
ncbi:MAG: NAD(P)/FAD-dependent oxidoreductase [Clostridia bacterium]|nr:NAD(P)/FAD-dependent oxidoreductase [Clostridia bacterium]